MPGWPLWPGKCDMVSIGAMRLDCPHSDGAPLSSMPQDLDAAVLGGGLGEDLLVGGLGQLVDQVRDQRSGLARDTNDLAKTGAKPLLAKGPTRVALYEVLLTGYEMPG